MGGRSELLKLEEQSQIKRKCADTIREPPGPAALEQLGFALRGWQPLFCPRLLLPAGWGASLPLKWQTPVHLGSPHSQGDKPHCLHGALPHVPQFACARAGHTAAEPGGHSAPASSPQTTKSIAVLACPWAGAVCHSSSERGWGASRRSPWPASRRVSVAVHRVGGEQ